MDTLILVSSNEIGKRCFIQHNNVIGSAKKAGVKHIIYTSLLGATNDNTVQCLASEHVETEAALKVSGITYTILRNTWYTENYTDLIPASIANNAFYGSAQNARIASALRAELAEAAVNVALGEGHDNQTYELSGSTSYTLADLAAEISKQTGKNIPYVDIPTTDYANELVKMGCQKKLQHSLLNVKYMLQTVHYSQKTKPLRNCLAVQTAGLDVAVKQAL